MREREVYELMECDNKGSRWWSAFDMAKGDDFHGGVQDRSNEGYRECVTRLLIIIWGLKNGPY